MPQNQHYRQAGHLLDEVRGADAADELAAYQRSIEQIATLLEISEKYQRLHEDATAPAKGTPHRDNRAA